MSVLDRSSLEDSPLADLHALASELGIDGFRRLRKADLVDAILDRQGGEEDEPAPDEDDEAAAELVADEDEAPARPARARRGRGGGGGGGGGRDRDGGERPARAE